jgi:hypothetical protein
MSDLETAVQPYMGGMVLGQALKLDKDQQQTIAVWTTKMAMVLEKTALAGRDTYYSQMDCEQLRLSSTVPKGSLVWLGMLSSSALHIDGVDLWFNVGEDTKAAYGCVTTLVVGYLVAQIISVRFAPNFLKKVNLRIHCLDGPWGASLVGIWPPAITVGWPPRMQFSDGGGSVLPISALRNRWRYGRPRVA